MTSLMMEEIGKSGVRMNNIKLLPLINWFYFLNIFTIAVLCLVFLKIYKCLILLYDWLFPFKYNIQSPKILVIGPKTEIIREIVFQLCQKFNSEIVDLQNINNNSSSSKLGNEKSNKSQLIYSHTPIKSQKVVAELFKYVHRIFGYVDVLVVVQNEETTESSNCTHSYLNQLNKQLLTQFWTVMAFLPDMLRRNKGYIISIALGKASLANTGIMRTVHEELLQCDTNVKLSLVETNNFLTNYLPSLSSNLLARLIVRSMWNFETVVKVPSLSSYILMLPILLMKYLLKPILLITNLACNRLPS